MQLLCPFEYLVLLVLSEHTTLTFCMFTLGVKVLHFGPLNCIFWTGLFGVALMGESQIMCRIVSVGLLDCGDMWSC
jgi:hypothetical protein